VESALDLFVVPAGTVRGDSCLDAIKTILSNPALTNYFNYNQNNISLGYNPTIDNGAALDNLPMIDAMRELLLVSNSILSLDASNNIIVTNRRPRGTTAKLFSYATSIDNVLKIKKYKSGIARTYNLIEIEQQQGDSLKYTNTDSIESHGVLKKTIKIVSIKDTTTLANIGNNVLSELAQPKPEIELELETQKLLPRLEEHQKIQLSIKPKTTVPTDKAKSFWNDGRTFADVECYSQPIGNIQIHPLNNWKVISVKEDTKKHTSLVTLKQDNTAIFVSTDEYTAAMAYFGFTNATVTNNTGLPFIAGTNKIGDSLGNHDNAKVFTIITSQGVSHKIRLDIESVKPTDNTIIWSSTNA
jgi:hypothetical protein